VKEEKKTIIFQNARHIRIKQRYVIDTQSSNYDSEEKKLCATFKRDTVTL